MHVLQLGPYPPPEGGINRNILAIREELEKTGHRCSIIATSRSTRITPEPDVHHPSSALELIKLLRSIDSNVLHLHIGGDITKRVLALAWACCTFGRGMKVLSVHSGGYPSTKKGKAAKRNSLRGLIFRMFNRIIAVNPTIAEVFARHGISWEHIHVIYPFVHRLPDQKVSVPANLKEFIRKHQPAMLTVGLLEPEYDLIMQIDAMEKVLAELPNAGLMIVGSGSLEAELKAAIEAKPYKDRILLAGDVEHGVTLHLINDSDVLLRTTQFDGDAISVREALFLETPVIATDNGMRPEGVKLIPVQNAGALLDQIGILSRSEKERKQPASDDMSNVHAILKLYEA
ncbi:hypothetical protein BH20ACI2_BH20ACI2_03130 [soil metagenome]